MMPRHGRTRTKERGKAQEVRIIGGMWRGRKVRFADRPGLRPTPSRLRETLFNWLRPEIGDLSCLDLFAGSGILGLEALSQGAGSVTFVDRDAGCSEAIAVQAEAFGAAPTVVNADALDYLARAREAYDLVFVDPPYDADELLTACLERIAERDLVRRYVYVECRDLTKLAAPTAWQLKRESRAGDARGALFAIAR